MPRWLGWWGSSPALERKKESEVRVLRRLQCPPETPTERSSVPLKPTLCSIRVPSPWHQATSRTMSRAHAHLVEMAQHSRFNIPQAQQHGLSALATELQSEQKSSELPGGNSTVKKFTEGEGEGNSVKEDTAAQSVITEGGSEQEVLQEDDVVTQFVFTEVSESTEPRFITPKLDTHQFNPFLHLHVMCLKCHSCFLRRWYIHN